ncbi:hypothetical protein BJY00DRAFT_316449 [Aspergillus carlsbadensis]|nr:hypothetical protein BJY00DRAFT_316449 [Aspergillus carlsbadensis]
MNASSNPLSRPIIVGLDFGTSGTAFSYAKPVKTGPRQYGNVFTPDPWPSGASEHKVPTRIAYRCENVEQHGFGQQDFVWGFRVAAGMTMSSWFKVLLHRETSGTPYSDGVLDEAVQAGVLRLPRANLHFVCPNGGLDRQPLTVWVTVPVCWGPAAIGALETAASRAGFGQRAIDEVRLATEADAAIEYVVHLLGNRFEVNEGVLVCDVGAGTTDVTSFQVTGNGQPIQWNRLRDDQVGGRCAGAAVESNIYRLLSQRLGPAFESLPVANKGPGSRFGCLLEKAKHEFGPASTEPQPLLLKMDPRLLANNPYYSDGGVLVTRQDLQQCFDPVLREIIQLVEMEIKLTQLQFSGVKIKHIVFVGGMIESSYMQRMLEFQFAASYKLAIPEQPRLAVTKGAALRGSRQN